KLFGLTPAPDAAVSGEAGQLRSWNGTPVLRCGDGWVRVAEIQPFGKPRMAAADSLRGHGDIRFDLRTDQGASDEWPNPTASAAIAEDGSGPTDEAAVGPRPGRIVRTPHPAGAGRNCRDASPGKSWSMSRPRTPMRNCCFRRS